MRLHGLLLTAFMIAFSGMAAAAPSENFSPNTDRPGFDIRNIPFRGNAQACLGLCNRDSQCRAWTFVKAGVQGPLPVCWLKFTIPQAVPNRCCTSGVIRRNL